jgi:hypothetical protein
MGRHKGPILLPSAITHPLRATVEEFSRAYEAASPDEQAELRVWMRHIVMPNKARRTDLAKSRSKEKESVEARDRRIMEFPVSMTPNAVAKALRAEGLYSKGTTVYYIEHRVRRLREKAQRE